MKIAFRSVFLLGFTALFLCSAVAAAAESLGRVSGQLEIAAAEPCSGLVSLWPAVGSEAPDPRLYNTVPPWIDRLQDDCSFSLQAAPGSYFLRVVLRRSAGPAFGPTRQGDLIFLSPDAQGNSLQVDLQAGQPVDVGGHSAGWEFPGYSDQIQTGITGQVIDASGRPLAGLLVHAFTDPSLDTPPLAVAAATDQDGRFQLGLEQGGKYYLQARAEVGFGSVESGQLIGVYGDKKAKALTVQPGKLLTDIRIKAAPQQSKEPN